MAHFQTLSASSYAITYSQTYLEQGRYAEAITSTGAEAAFVDTRVPDVTFVDATQLLPPQPGLAAGERQAGSVALFDLDGDGDLDVLEAGAGRSATCTEMTAAALPTSRMSCSEPSAVRPATGFLAGDYDNDGAARPGGARADRRATAPPDAEGILGRDDGRRARVADRRLRPRRGSTPITTAISTSSSLSPGAAAVDAAAPQQRRWTFVDVTKEAGHHVARGRLPRWSPPTIDNRRDIDMLVTATGAPILFRNLREGTFQDVAGDVGLALDSGASRWPRSATSTRTATRTSSFRVPAPPASSRRATAAALCHCPGARRDGGRARGSVRRLRQRRSARSSRR